MSPCARTGPAFLEVFRDTIVRPVFTRLSEKAVRLDAAFQVADAEATRAISGTKRHRAGHERHSHCREGQSGEYLLAIAGQRIMGSDKTVRTWSTAKEWARYYRTSK